MVEVHRRYRNTLAVVQTLPQKGYWEQLMTASAPIVAPQIVLRHSLSAVMVRPRICREVVAFLLLARLLVAAGYIDHSYHNTLD